tara:strand:- start:15 stop:221 length:207 start_codon:yes stop_codon:yes gene_type:complete
MNEQSWYSEKDTSRVIDSLLDKQEMIDKKIDNSNSEVDELKDEINDLKFALYALMFLNTCILMAMAFS